MNLLQYIFTQILHTIFINFRCENINKCLINDKKHFIKKIKNNSKLT